MEYRSPPVAAGLILGLLAACLCLPLPARAAEGGASPPTPEQRADWDRRLADAKELQKQGAVRRGEAKEAFEARKKECFKQFRVTDCQGEARQRYIAAANEARRIENEGKALERQVKKEELADKDARRLAQEPQRQADLEAREAETRAEREQDDAARAAKLAGKEEKARVGAERHAAAEERLRRKQEKHTQRLAEKTAKAKARDEEADR